MTITVATRTHKVLDRVYAMEIHANHGESPYVRINREHVLEGEDGAAIATTRDIPEQVLSLADIAADTIEVGGMTLTMEQVVGIIGATADHYRQLDLAPPAPPPAP